MTGKPVQVLDNVAIGGWGGGAFLAVSDNGTIIFIKRSDWPCRVFRMTDMNGRTIESRIAVSPSMLAKMGLSGVGTLNISPDGERAVFVNWKAGGTDLWMLDSRIGEPQRFTIDPAEDEYPAWAPDGGAVAYTTNMPGAACRISVKSAESGAAATPLRTWPRHFHVISWSHDGKWLAADDYHPTNKSDIVALPLNGKEPVAVATGPANESGAQFSPDGRWIAYTSDESGRREVWVVSFPELASRRQVSMGGGTNPQWDPKGHVLYYLQNGYLVSHEIRATESLSLGRSQQLFPTPAIYMQSLPGGRFFLTEPNLQPRDTPIHLIVNWFEELKRLLSAGNG